MRITISHKVVVGLAVLVWVASVNADIHAQEQAGVGIALRTDGGHIVIGRILPDTPAAANRAIKVGDRIIAVGQSDDPPVNVTGLTIPDVVRLLRGPKGTVVRLTLVGSKDDLSQVRMVILIRGELKGVPVDDDSQQNNEWKKNAPKFLLEIDALQNECQEELKPAQETFEKVYRTAKTEAEREKARKNFDLASAAVLRPAVQKIFELVEPHGAEPASIGPLLWIVRQCPPVDEESKPVQGAVDLLVKHHLTNQRTLDQAYVSKSSGLRWVERMLRAQVAAPELQEDSRLRQTLALATYLQRSAEKDRPDTAKLVEEAVEIFTELGEKYPNKEIGPESRLTISEYAKAALFEITNLGLGNTAPDIEGEDMDGVAFKLSDYRGRVVLISFWGSWCGPCMEFTTDEKELVERYRGRPFAIVGVNSDSDRERLKPILAKHQITWRSFWCGKEGWLGAIPTSWNVYAWPTVYLIDRGGIIRAKNVRGAGLRKKIEELVAEAETARPQN